MGQGRAAGKPERLWTGTFIILTCVNFIQALSFYLLMVKMTQYVYETYHVAQSVAAGAVTSYVIGALVTRFFFGRKIDEWGVRRSLFIGLGVNAAMGFVYLVPMGIVPLYIVRFLHGFGFALSSGSAAAAAVLVIPDERRGEGVGYFSMAQALATGVGPFVAIAIMNAGGSFTILFLITGILCAVAFASLFLLKLPPAAYGRRAQAGTQDAECALRTDGADGKGTADDADGNAHRTGKSAAPRSLLRFIQVSILPLAGTMFLAYLAYAGVLSFMTLYTQEAGLTQASTFYFVIYAAAILLTRPFTGKYVDRKGPDRIVYLAMAAIGAGLVLMWQVGGIADAGNRGLAACALLVSAGLLGFGIGNTQSVIQAVIAKTVPEDELGRANSTFFMSMDLGSGLGPVLIGLIIPFTGYAGSYLVLVSTAVAGLLLYYFRFVRRRKTHGTHPEP